ncbi:MAG: phosphotransferase [Parachlamydiaceae bacterium]|nr:phosphotransferase [Parachlamydiaceae bacterium]
MNIFNFWLILKKLSFFIVLIIGVSSCVQKDKLSLSPQSTQESRISDKIKSIFSVPHDQKIKIEKITEGRSDSSIYKAFLNEKNYIVRMLSPERALNERKWEVELVKKTADKNISPHVYYVSPDYQMIVMDFTAGENFFGSITRKPFLLQSLAQKLYILHSLPISPLTPKIPTLEKNFFVKTEAKEYQELLNNFRNLEKSFLKNSNLAITHTDVHPGNLIADQKDVWMIDWQDAGLYGPLYDLARFVVDVQLSPSDEAIFLKAYFNKEMTLEEKENYLRAKKMSYIKIIDSLISVYVKNTEDKETAITKLFIDAKKDLSAKDNLILELIGKSNFNEMRRKMSDLSSLRIVLLHMMKNYQKL